MIRNDSEYRQAVKQRDAQAERLKAQRSSLVAAKLSASELERAMEPVESFHQQLVEEIELYEELKRGGLGAVSKLGSFGQQLVGLRIATGLTQRELAERLDIHESQVSRDERNEYHGVTYERASKILAAMGLEMVPSYLAATRVSVDAISKRLGDGKFRAPSQP